MPDGRVDRLREITSVPVWDVLVIGGGASGLGTAVEAASRGYRTLLLERNDFAQGTSSRSTKLVHGGVRYLQQFNVTLVLDALRERGYMLRNAPHLVHKLDFAIPLYTLAGIPYYAAGLKLYEMLSGKLSFGKSEVLSTAETLAHLPTVRREGLRGGVLYRDGQFDDSRYAIALLLTLEDLGGTALNYAEVRGLLKRDGKIEGVSVQDREAGDEFEIRSRVVINATGAFTEGVLRMDEPATGTPLSLSQGSHFVLPPDFLPSRTALMVPKTEDGRVLFAIPWHGHLLVGTTEQPVAHPREEPHATGEETKFLADHISKYLGRTVVPTDVLSMWSGLRPLVRSGNKSTSALSRDHHITVSPAGLVSVVGGKWTTYRKMGEDTVDRAASAAGLTASPSRTVDLKLHGWQEPDGRDATHETVYGSDAAALRALAEETSAPDELLHPALPYRRAEVLWAVRNEQARTVEDVLARRTRGLFLNARASIAAAETVSRLLAAELGRTEEFRVRDLQHFQKIAQGYTFAG